MTSKSLKFFKLELDVHDYVQFYTSANFHITHTHFSGKSKIRNNSAVDRQSHQILQGGVKISANLNF